MASSMAMGTQHSDVLPEAGGLQDVLHEAGNVLVLVVLVIHLAYPHYTTTEMITLTT